MCGVGAWHVLVLLFPLSPPKLFFPAWSPSMHGRDYYFGVFSLLWSLLRRCRCRLRKTRKCVQKQNAFWSKCDNDDKSERKSKWCTTYVCTYIDYSLFSERLNLRRVILVVCLPLSTGTSPHCALIAYCCVHLEVLCVNAFLYPSAGANSQRVRRQVVSPTVRMYQ